MYYLVLKHSKPKVFDRAEDARKKYVDTFAEVVGFRV